MKFDIRPFITDMPLAARDLLADRFNGSPLAYHNIDHIYQMLTMFECSFRDDCSPDDERLMRYAIWFHDVVYDPTASDNEERSANAASAYLDLSNQQDLDIRSLIMATKKHQSDQPGHVGLLQRWLIDLDLSILGSPREQYMNYARAIRIEYSRYDDQDYLEGRTRVLTTLMEKPLLLENLSLYRFGNKAELGMVARQNMEWERSVLPLAVGADFTSI